MSESTLTSLLLDDRSKRPAILTDCERLIDSEVAAKSGLSGMAIKGAFKVVQKIKPGIIREAMDSLIDDFVSRLEPLFAEYMGSGDADPKAFDKFLNSNRSRTADALLGVTDDRAKRAKNKTMKNAYDKLRPQAKKHVEDAIPGAARIFVKHIG